MGNFELLHSYENVRRNDEADRKDGINPIYITETTDITKEVNLGRTRQEVKTSLKELFQGIDEQTLDELTDRAIESQISKDQLKDFAIKEKPGLTVESMDTSAIPAEKVQDSKANSFVPKVQTPTAPKATIPKDKSGDLTNEGPEI